MRIRTGIALIVLLLGQGSAGCSSSYELPAAPAVTRSVPEPPAIELVVFTDPSTGFATSDVHDVNQQIVRFNTANDLIWLADGTRFSGYPVRGDLVFADATERWLRLQIRFGTAQGERRAYATWYDDDDHYYPGTVADLEVESGRLVMKETATPVPGT